MDKQIILELKQFMTTVGGYEGLSEVAMTAGGELLELESSSDDKVIKAAATLYYYYTELVKIIKPLER